MMVFWNNTAIRGPVLHDLVHALLVLEARKATKYLSPTVVVKATRRLFKGRIDRREKRVEILLTIGAPNYAERRAITQFKKAGESFPVRKVQVRFPVRAKRS